MQPEYRSQTRLLEVSKRPQRQRLQNQDDGERAAAQHPCDQQKPVRPFPQRAPQAHQARDEQAKSSDEVSQRVEGQRGRIEELRRPPEQNGERVPKNREPEGGRENRRTDGQSQRPSRRPARHAVVWLCRRRLHLSSYSNRRANCFQYRRNSCSPGNSGVKFTRPRVPRRLRCTAAVQRRCRTPQAGTRSLLQQDFWLARAQGLVSPIEPRVPRSIPPNTRGIFTRCAQNLLITGEARESLSSRPP